MQRFLQSYLTGAVVITDWDSSEISTRGELDHPESRGTRPSARPWPRRQQQRQQPWE